MNRKQLLSVGMILLAVLLASPLNLLAQTVSDTETMAEANELYDEGLYAEAARVYEQLVAKGIQNSALNYNLGNAYFKQGNVGRAILNYKRATRSDPRDLDIQTNLAVARATTLDQLDSENEAFVVQLTRLAQSWLNINEMSLAALGLWFLLVILLIIFVRSTDRVRQGTKYAAIVVFVFLLGGVVSLGSRLWIESTFPEGVIVADEIEVVSGPGAQHVIEFTLHSGAEVSLLETRGTWARLSLPGDQLQGWVPSDAISAVAFATVNTVAP